MVNARFTPSLLDESTLEALFVHRGHLVDSCVAMIERAVTTSERGARLFVGPRGAGKTHLISLVYHRARRLSSFGSGFQLAWLPEDPWTIGSFDDLVEQILTVLEPAPPTTRLDVDKLRAAASEHGPIVVLAENLDQILEGIGSEGQRALRALIENHGCLVVVATTTRLSAELSNQAEPFYGFFDTTVLEPFTADMARDMLTAIAVREGNQEMVNFLATPRARRRLAAVEHLAGGQPRVWALLAAGLTIDELDELVDALVERFDDLTPYYQSQMQLLSRNERRVVKALTERDGAVTVKALAEHTGIGQTSLAKTLSDLRRRGWVRPRTGPIVEMGDKRNTYYELAEPLARLTFQLKESHGQPVRLVVDFLKLWFDRSDLEHAGSSAEGMALVYLQEASAQLLRDPIAALVACLTTGNLLNHTSLAPTSEFTGLISAEHLASIDDALASLDNGDPEPSLALPAAVTALIEHDLASGTSILQLRLNLADVALTAELPAVALAIVERVMPLLDDRRTSQAVRTAAIAHADLGQFDQALSLLGIAFDEASTQEIATFVVYGLERAAARALRRDPASDGDPRLSFLSFFFELCRVALERRQTAGNATARAVDGLYLSSMLWMTSILQMGEGAQVEIWRELFGQHRANELIQALDLFAGNFSAIAAELQHPNGSPLDQVGQVQMLLALLTTRSRDVADFDDVAAAIERFWADDPDFADLAAAIERFWAVEPDNDAA